MSSNGSLIQLPPDPASGSLEAPESLPLGTTPLRSGMLKVVDPSPFPHASPIALNRSLYPDLLTIDPSQSNQPEGMLSPANGIKLPDGSDVPTPDADAVLFAITLSRDS